MPRVAAKPTKGSRTAAPVRKARSTKKSVSSSRAPRKASGLKYPGVGRGLGSALGSFLGPTGSVAGGLLGDLAQTAIHKITGFGDYTLPTYPIEKNVLLETNSPPIVQNNGKEFIIRHREYLGDVYSGVAGSPGNPTPTPFTNTVYNINPGLTASFPWLANVAGRFEEYQLEGMLYEFKSMYSDAVVQTGGSLGTVVMATEYNASKPAFTSKIEMENYEFAMSSKPSVPMCHPIECNNKQSVLSQQYVRTNNAALVNQDIKMYDFGTFQIASVGIPCTGQALSLGELWCTYQIKLLKPRISDYIDSGYARLNLAQVAQPSGGHVFDPVNQWVTYVDTIGVKLVDFDTLSITMYPTARTYMVNILTGDGQGGISQSAAVGYYPNAGTYVYNNCSAVIPSAYDASQFPFFTKTGGTVNSSGTVWTGYILVAALSPGQAVATIKFPIGTLAGLLYHKAVIVNAVPAFV